MSASDKLLHQHQIAARSYEIYIQSGRIEGRERENWLQAEKELKSALTQPTGVRHPALEGTALKEPDDEMPGAEGQGGKRNKIPPVSLVNDGIRRGDKKTGKAGERGGAQGNREGIQQVAHRVMGSRQSKRTAERSNQRRQPKRGPSSQKPVE